MDVPAPHIEINQEGGEAEPTLAGSTVPVAAVVRACHERAIDQALADLSIPGLSRGTLEPILTYCAERRCAADNAACPGCRRRAEAQQLATLDDFAALHREIVIGDGTLRIAGPGAREMSAPSLDNLAKTWAGEEYWFWARRVLRKLRHGVRRGRAQGEPAAPESPTPAVILMEPQLADNIGMVSRAMANFGLDNLRLIAPRDGWPNEKARIAASGANYIIDDAVAFSALGAAVADLNWLAAATARQRDLRKPILTPEQAVAEARVRIARGERCGFLFGRERNGLETDEIANADALVMIPVNARFASLNLAQAVLLIAYEWMQAGEDASLGRVTTYEKPVSTGVHMGADRPASKEELLGLFEHLEGELERLGFFNPLHKRTVVARNLRTMLLRMSATAQEVRTLRGVVATLAMGKGAGRKDSS